MIHLKMLLDDSFKKGECVMTELEKKYKGTTVRVDEIARLFPDKVLCTLHFDPSTGTAYLDEIFDAETEIPKAKEWELNHLKWEDQRFMFIGRCLGQCI